MNSIERRHKQVLEIQVFLLKEMKIFTCEMYFDAVAPLIKYCDDAEISIKCHISNFYKWIFISIA